MNKYKEVFELAESKGYQLALNWSNKAPRMLFSDEDRLTIELTLIQKWLRDTHQIYVQATPNNSVSLYGRNFDTEIKWIPVYVPSDCEEKESKFDTYEFALLEGINQALQLL